MQPKHKQGPLRSVKDQQPVRKPQGPTFKEGDYVPLAIIVISNGRPQNVHLPQKLIAIKDFKQLDALQAYHFQHPQQPAMLDPQRPDIHAFNGAVVNMHKWMIKNGYCRQEGVSDLKVHVWTDEEMAVARAEEAEMRKQIMEGNISPEVMETLRKAGVNLQDIAMEPAEDRTQLNVGTVGHVDHGKSALAGIVEQTQREPVQPVTIDQRIPDDLELMYPVNAELLDIHNNDVAKSYPATAISAAELIAADPKGGL